MVKINVKHIWQTTVALAECIASFIESSVSLYNTVF